MRFPQLFSQSRLSGLAWLLLVASSITAIVAGSQRWGTPLSVEVVVRMSKTTEGAVQLFTDTRAGYQEARSVMLAPAAAGAVHDYRLRLSDPAALRAFRLDPGSGPGRVVLHRIDVLTASKPVRLEAAELRSATQPLKHLLVAGSGNEVSFVSQGVDPFLEVTLPVSLRADHEAFQESGRLLAVLGMATLLVLLWLARKRLRTLPIPVIPKWLGIFALTVVLALALLSALRTGCDGWCSIDGLRYGGGLLLASAAMAVVGAAVLSIAGLRTRPGDMRLFLWIIVGQTALLVYVFVRSALHGAMPMLPLGAAELGLLVLAAAVYLSTVRRRPGIAAMPRRLGWAAIESGLLVAVCLVVADRELPRLIMLSSDPDTHAYLARQLERLGGIPWQGELTFNYPAGTAAMGFVWARLSLLDVRNAMSALPLLQGFLAALLLGEALALRVRPIPDRLLVVLTTVGVTAAGFLIPLYVNFSHMEGTGRQIAIATAALVPALLITRDMARDGAQRRVAAILLASLFTLAVLNPISIVVPVILAIAYVLYSTLAQRRFNGWWVAALLACPLLLLLDPYYFNLLTGSAASPDKVTVNAAMQAKGVPETLAAWHRHHVSRPLGFLLDARQIARGQTAPMFAVLLASLFALRLLLKPRLRMNPAALLAIALAILALAAAEGLFAALRDDRRFYLLDPYYAFTLAQLKILLVTALAGSVIVLGSARRLRLHLQVALSLLMVLLVYFGMRSSQMFALAPRADYCGSLGCVSDDDVLVMRRFEQMISADGQLLAGASRVLVPNSVHDTRNEDWVFPITGARALPFYDVPPVAFFYYQGDDDYTTENYKAHVCNHFDRNWLQRQHITLVFLPSSRGSACMKDMESLPVTEEVLIQQGNSYLLRLR